MTEPNVNIPWPRIIADLQRAGIPMREQARRLGVTIGAMQAWQRGSIPAFHHGTKLLFIYKSILLNTKSIFG